MPQEIVSEWDEKARLRCTYFNMSLNVSCSNKTHPGDREHPSRFCVNDEWWCLIHWQRKPRSEFISLLTYFINQNRAKVKLWCLTSAAPKYVEEQERDVNSEEGKKTARIDNIKEKETWSAWRIMRDSGQWFSLQLSWAEWFLSQCWVFVPCLLCHWDHCLFKRLACQTESATDSQTLS